MSVPCETPASAAENPLGFFERYLTLRVFLCIAAGVALGHFFAPAFQAVGRLEIARINLPVAVLVWLMIFPMLLKVDFAALRRVNTHWKGIGVTLLVNWGMKPFSMALLAWLFIGLLFRPWLPVEPSHARRAALHAHAGGAERRHYGVRVRADRGAAARAIRDHGAVGYAAAVGAALYRRAADRRPFRAPVAARAHGRRGAPGPRHPVVPSVLARRVARDAGASLRLSGGNRSCASRS